MSTSSQELQANWTRSDQYHNAHLIPEDPILSTALQNSDDAGLDRIAVSQSQGKLLHLFARSIQAKRILEVGTLGGYSTIWLARAVPQDGEVVTLELEEEHVKVASKNFALAGLSEKIKIIVGPAAQSLETLRPSFDLAFIDADKQSNAIYYQHAKRLVRSGGIIIIDNVVRQGLVADTSRTDERIEGVRALLRAMKGDEEVDATTVATVGEKGYDGLIFAVRK